MADERETLHRVLQMKIRALGDPAQVLSLVKSTAPFYRALGGTQVRFLQNVDDPAQFAIEVEYEANAAIAGQGVAIVTRALFKVELGDGRLIQPFDIVGDDGHAYWLVYPSGRRNVPKIRLFRDWILAEVKDSLGP